MYQGSSSTIRIGSIIRFYDDVLQVSHTGLIIKLHEEGSIHTRGIVIKLGTSQKKLFLLLEIEEVLVY